MADKNKWLDAGVERMLKKPVYANSNITIVKNMLPQKMSEVLLDFAKPLLDTTDLSDKAATRSAVTVAVSIWNYSIITDENAPPRPSTGALDKIMKNPMTDRVFRSCFGERIFDELLSRKKSLYPDNYRIIGDFDLNWNESGSEFHLSVLATD